MTNCDDVYPGARKTDPEHGELVLTVDYSRPKNFGGSSEYWLAADATQVSCTSEELDCLRKGRDSKSLAD